MSIPKIIWQTYKDPFDKLPHYIVAPINSWKIKNPDWDHHYMTDPEIYNFVKEKYGNDWYKIFSECPKGVMRADIWRYLIVYEYGGVYTDVDTRCFKPINKWIDLNKGFIVCPENNTHFCQWTFAAEPKSPVLKAVIDLIEERLKKPDYNNKHYVHHLTGPGVWTDGIEKALLAEHKDITSNVGYYNSLPMAKKFNFFCFGSSVFNNGDVLHLYGSQNWGDGKYVQWIK